MSWLGNAGARSDASIRLFCLPFAGGGGSSYRTWLKELPPAIQVVPVRPPGREDRIREAPLTSIEAIVEGLTKALLPLTKERPFALFGHSLGALVALEVTRALAREGAAAPRHLICSGRAAPHLPLRRVPVRELSRDGLEQWLRSVNGTPEAVLANRDLMDLLLPALRADLNIDDCFESSPDPAVSCPLTVLGGSRDPETDRKELAEWRSYTSGSFDFHVIDGDHFFPFNEGRRATLAIVTGILAA